MPPTYEMWREAVARGWLELHSKTNLPPLLSNVVSTKLNTSDKAAAAAERDGLEIPEPTQELYELLRSYKIAIDVCCVTDDEHPRPIYLDRHTLFTLYLISISVKAVDELDCVMNHTDWQIFQENMEEFEKVIHRFLEMNYKWRLFPNRAQVIAHFTAFWNSDLNSLRNRE